MRLNYFERMNMKMQELQQRCQNDLPIEVGNLIQTEMESVYREADFFTRINMEKELSHDLLCRIYFAIRKKVLYLTGVNPQKEFNHQLALTYLSSFAKSL